MFTVVSSGRQFFSLQPRLAQSQRPSLTQCQHRKLRLRWLRDVRDPAPGPRILFDVFRFPKFPPRDLGGDRLLRERERPRVFPSKTSFDSQHFPPEIWGATAPLCERERERDPGGFATCLSTPHRDLEFLRATVVSSGRPFFESTLTYFPAKTHQHDIIYFCSNNKVEMRMSV